MRRLVLFMHTSLDGFVAGPQGEMDWIHVDEEIFDHVHGRVKETNTALYGRVTYEMMQAYWPTAAEQPNASKHDVDHAQWYNQAKKIVLSRTLQGAELPQTRVINGRLSDQIRPLKQETGSDILIFGSPSAAHALMAENLIDDYWLFVNPVLLGQGIPLFKGVAQQTALQLQTSHVFSSGVICLQYTTKAAQGETHV